MKTTAFIAAAFVAVASAQLEAIPPCALECALGSLGKTGCPTTDIACICKADSFITELIPCVTGACGEPGQFEAVVAAAGELCRQAGVTLTITPPGVSTTSEPASSSTSAPPTTTATETETSSTTETETSTTSEPSTSSTPSPSGNTTNPTSSTPPAPTGTDDSSAARNAIAFGGVALAMVAALL